MIRSLFAIRSLSTQKIIECSNKYVNYNNINKTEYKEWVKALPFEKIPGPKSLPLVGNVWRFFPKIGDLYGLQLHQMHYR